jgi:hypothetical protein
VSELRREFQPATDPPAEMLNNIRHRQSGYSRPKAASPGLRREETIMIPGEVIPADGEIILNAG